MAKLTPQSRRRDAALQAAALTDVDPQVKLALVGGILSRDAAPALQSDRAIYRIVVSALAAIGVVALMSVLFLLLAGKPQETTTTKDGVTTTGVGVLPDIFLALGSVAVGALAGLLAPSPQQAGGAHTNGGPSAAGPPTPTRPVIASIKPDPFPVAAADNSIAIAGQGFTKDSIATVNDTPHVATLANATLLTVALDPAEYANPGTLNIRVQTGDAVSDVRRLVVS